MFIGHYAFGFLLKRFSSRFKGFDVVPLWLVFIFVQLIDLIWPVLVILGVERVVYDAEANPFLRLMFVYYPFTHSLIATMFYGAVVFAIFYYFKNKFYAITLSIATISHWFLDLIVHTPDLPIIITQKVGLGLWNIPKVSLLIEAHLFGFAAAYYIKKVKDKKQRILLSSLTIFLIVAYVITYFAPAIEPTNLQLGLTTLFTLSIAPVAVYFIERKNK